MDRNQELGVGPLHIKQAQTYAKFKGFVVGIEGECEEIPEISEVYEPLSAKQTTLFAVGWDEPYKQMVMSYMQASHSIVEFQNATQGITINTDGTIIVDASPSATTLQVPTSDEDNGTTPEAEEEDTGETPEAEERRAPPGAIRWRTRHG